MDQHAIDHYDDIETRLEREAEREGWGDLQRRALVAAERQAAALERIADSVNSIDGAAQRQEERLTEIEGQLGRIAAVLEMWRDWSPRLVDDAILNNPEWDGVRNADLQERFP